MAAKLSLNMARISSERPAMSFLQLGLAGFQSPTWARRNSYRWLTSAYSSMALTFTLPRALILPRTSDTWRRSFGPALKRHAQLLRGGERQLVFFPELCHRLLVLGVLLLLLLGQAGDLTSQRLALVRDLAHPRRLLGDAAFLSMRRRTAPALASSRFSISFRLPAMAARMVSICAARSAFWAVSVSMFAASCLARASLSSVRLSQLGNGRAVALDILLSGQRLQFQVGKLVRKGACAFPGKVSSLPEMARSSSSSAALSPCKHLHLGGGVRPPFFARRDLRGKLGALGGKHFPRGPRLGQRGGDAPAFHLAADLVAPAVMASLSVAVSSAESASTSAFALSVFSSAASRCFSSASTFFLQLVDLLLAAEQPAERETLPPVNEPPALTTWPSTVTTRLR